VEAEVEAPTGQPKPVVLVVEQISTAQELQVRWVRETQEVGVAQLVDGQVVVVVELPVPVEALQVIMLAARVETAFNSPSEASPTSQQLEAVERANGEEERLVPTPPEEESEEVALMVEVMEFHGVAVEAAVVSTITPEYGVTRVAMAEVELCLLVM
jgi:hypothetical protein